MSRDGEGSSRLGEGSNRKRRGDASPDKVLERVSQRKGHTEA